MGRPGNRTRTRFHGTASGPAKGFIHQALIYGSDQEFIDVALPFVEEAVAAGLARSRADEVVLAINEVATNAVLHGQSPAIIRIWHEENELVFEVSDAGEGITDALAGQLAPPSASLGGRGLWLTRLVCDAVEIPEGSGCTVAIRATTPSFSLTA
jgi:anti-sigma regulatory factor (Ser/Thr protein kinase)